MLTVVLNAAVAIVAIALVLGVWIGVHLLAQRRVGERKLGCSGPTPNAEGGVSCCSQSASCDNPPPRCGIGAKPPQDPS